jgi:hypothetical protein
MSRGVRQVDWAPRDRWNFAVLPGPGRVGGGGVAWAQTALMCTRCVPSGSSIGLRAGSPPSGCERPCAWLFTPDRRPRRPRSVRAARTAEARRRGSSTAGRSPLPGPSRTVAPRLARATASRRTAGSVQGSHGGKDGVELALSGHEQSVGLARGVPSAGVRDGDDEPGPGRRGEERRVFRVLCCP